MKDDGGPAFAHGDPIHGGDPGMCLRDWFAGMALQGILLASNYFHPEKGPEELARACYGTADAMLEARKK